MIGVFTSFLISFVGAWLMARYACRFGLLDTPSDRSSHNQPTPRGGGVGILAALIIEAILLKIPLSFWLPAVLLSLVSFFDDKLDLSAITRLICQFAAAFVVLWFHLPHFIASSFFVAHVSVVWSPVFLCLLLLPASIFVVGTANFFNFMDGINGMAGITGVVAFGLISLFAHMWSGEPALMLLAVCIAAACLGFLPLNIPKARVFMGDVGSILLGFVFAVICLDISKSIADFLVLCGFLFTFYADALTTLYIRKRDGDKLSQAHRRHVYQLLANQMQIPHWRISLGFGVIQACIGASLLWLRSRGAGLVALSELLLLAFWWLLMKHLRRFEGS